MKNATEMRTLTEQVKADLAEEIREEVIHLCDNVIMDKIREKAEEGKDTCAYNFYGSTEEEKKILKHYLNFYGYKVVMLDHDWIRIEW